MNNEKIKQFLKDIQIKKMETKSKLKMVSFLLSKDESLKKEMDNLLDKLSLLERLEEEIKKRK